jgi:hypothetical protein
VIGKISDPRGTRVAGLLYYLFGPGRREEHTDPHLVAGWRDPADLEPSLRPDGRRDFRRLAGLLQQPHTALGPRGFERPVWHCSVRAAPQDRMLSDPEWAQVAADVMHRTGLAPRGQEDDAVRWVAVRHGAYHIHLVAMLARQDGGRPRLSNERYRVREACRAAEEHYGLRRTAPGDRTAGRRASRAEREKAQRRGRSEAPRMTLRRAVSTAAAGASSEEEFFARLADSGVLVRKRLSTRHPGEVTGYSVALPDDMTRDGSPVWFSGGKLAADLTLPKLRSRWEPTRATPPPTGQFTAEERDALWEHAARVAAEASAHIHASAATDPGEAADAAWAAADTLHVAAAALGSQVLRQAAYSYDRAARFPYGRIPQPTRAGNSLRYTARLLARAATPSDDIASAVLNLIVQLAALVEAVAEMRYAQQHAAQAAAAHSAAGRLHVAAAQHRAQPRTYQRPGPRTAANLAGLDSAGPLRPAPRPTGTAGSRPTHRGPQPAKRRRGPAL